MADERTASTMTWLNSALRNRQKSTTLINQVQIRQWHFMNAENNKSPRPKPTVKFRDLDETIFGQEVDENESSDAGDAYEDSDAWLDGSVNLVDEDDPGYLRCSNRVFVGSEDARLDGPELLDLLSDKPIETEAQDRSQTPGPSSQAAGGGPVAWKFNFSQIL
ncbi:hypothetical protein DEU56DRAFT_404574 [Suillus clintonianus]|uniref:uncharacterized protein n=1 Tax=Suillus clintonianus TaxID=1904413 RepID=UPI001B86DE6F|nr:uncharacterized protein DEU56DRAFT_404574 [Suillus clintonianus]KAG2134814.1 hypothetical protein DEU56DRAFT_404574 [Suillus clintonianus]